jgi:hypothetical protein
MAVGFMLTLPDESNDLVEGFFGARSVMSSGDFKSKLGSCVVIVQISLMRQINKPVPPSMYKNSRCKRQASIRDRIHMIDVESCRLYHLFPNLLNHIIDELLW